MRKMTLNIVDRFLWNVNERKVGQAQKKKEFINIEDNYIHVCGLLYGQRNK